MPKFAKLSHISFSCRDLARSVAWWHQVVGLSELDYVEGEGWRAVLMIHDPSATIIEFQQHAANQGETFDPRRTGFDHMGFKVDSRGELDHWEDFFLRLGVDHTPIAERDYGAVLTFRDPDGIQLEMFFRENHP